MRAELRIEKLVYGGSGLARHGGSVVFVPFVLPGEEIEAELIQNRGGTFRGSVVRGIRQSADRKIPPCAVFGQCGGCHYQHMPYDRECEYKVEILRETLQRIGGLHWDGEIEVSRASPLGYRNRTQLRLERRPGSLSVGFRASGSHRHVETEDCAINSPKLCELHRKLCLMTQDRRFPRDLESVELFACGGGVQMNLSGHFGPLPRKFRSWFGERLGVRNTGAPLDCRCGPDLLRVSARSFFQVNRFLAPTLAELAVGNTSGGLVLDLYCGVGLFTLPLARRHNRVYGVDSSSSATRDLQANASRAGVSVRIVHLGVAEFLRGFADRPSLIVADPPRSGLGAAVVREVLRLAPSELRLVSCHPATLARDVKQLVAGGYGVERIHMIDMFPQTYHIETITVLQAA